MDKRTVARVCRALNALDAMDIPAVGRKVEDIADVINGHAIRNGSKWLIKYDTRAMCWYSVQVWNE